MNLLRVIRRIFSLSCRNVSAVKWKALISVSTILIGSLAITATFTISENIDVYVKYLIDENGGPKITTYFYSQTENVENSDFDKIRSASKVRSVFGETDASVESRYEDASTKLSLKAIDINNYNKNSVNMITGRFYNKLDFVDPKATIILSKNAVEKLKIDKPLGKLVSIRTSEGDILLRIIGVARSSGNSYGQSSAWTSMNNFYALTGNKFMTSISIVSESSSWMNWSQKFEKKFGNAFWVQNPLQDFMEMKERLETFVRMGYILGFLALIAGSIGATSVMILNVNLRRREIGLYKAMGFSSVIVLSQFAAESLILSIVGGFIGAFLGSLLGLVVSKDIFTVGEFSLVGLVFGLLSAIFTGVLFGLIPAFLASRVEPVKALQG